MILCVCSAAFLVMQVSLVHADITQTQLAGNSLAEYPFFEYVRAFNENATVEVAIDPTRFAGIVGQTCDIYVVDAKSAAQWAVAPSLTDVTPGGAQTETFSGATIQANTFQVAGPFQLNADAGLGLGVGYDVVLDFDQDGQLSDGDFIDGLSLEAGFYVVHDTTAAGPLAVTEVLYSLDSIVGASFSIPATKLAENLYYPTDVGSMGQLPLIVIGHGNGHNYRWYDHIGYHLASYGYIVMSHDNNTGPGVESAATTTLGHTDAFINQAEEGAIAGGALTGHLDSSRITWIGHSRGAEGVAISYDRLFDGSHTPTHFDLEDIKLISSMLPTDFRGTDITNPHDANYHLWTASGDSDVNGSAGCSLCQTFHIHDRAAGYRQSTVVQGTGHAWFHDGSTSAYFTGPCSIGPTNDLTHLIQLGHFLPLIKHYVEGNIPALDFLTRQYERFRPIGVPTGNPCIVVSHEYRNGSAVGNFVVDDYQTQTNTGISSSGGQVTFDVENLTEGRLDDNNSDFVWSASDPFNGATQAAATDSSRGVVFDWTDQDRFYEWEIIPGQRDFTDNLYLSFRGAQGTRHPNTLAVLGDLTFSVTLRDTGGTSSTINIGAFGGGLEQPYQRDGGWHNEMETIRIRLTDFLNNNSGLNLSDIVAVRLDVGPSWGSSRGRIVVDDVMLTNDRPPYEPRDPVDIVLLLDYSNSMNSPASPSGRDKIEVLKDAVEVFLRTWEVFAHPGDRVDIVYFDDDVDPLSINLQPLLPNVQTLIDEVRTRPTGMYTAMGGALHVALTGLSSGTSHPAIILFTNGIQNVNPLAYDVGGQYEIINRPSSEAWGGTSSVAENPGTSLGSYGIPVHAIGIDVAAATSYHTLLNGIRIETGGLIHLTIDPASDLHQFYLEHLVAALNLGTLEMVDYKRGTILPAQHMSETFVMDGAIKRAAFLVHWVGGSFPRIKIDGPHPDYENLQPTRWVNGNFYRIAYFDFPYVLDGQQIDPVGTWRIYTEESSGTIPYHAALLVDEIDIHYKFNLSRELYWTGDPIILNAEVTESGNPIKSLTSVKAALTYPQTALGTLLSTKPGTASPTRTDLHSTRGHSKLVRLLENPLIRKLLEPKKIVLELYDDGKSEHGDSQQGDGIFSAKLENTKLPGLYSFVFDVEGNTTTGWPIKRIQTHSTIVRVKPDLDKTRKTARWIKRSADGSGTALITVIPYDKFENYLGPDYGNAVRFSTTYGNLESDIYDALDGSYEFKLHLPDRSQDPTIDLSVFGFNVYKGPLSKLFQVTENFGLSAHLGYTFPAGNFNLIYDSDLSWGVDFELILTNYLSLEALFGYHTFKSDTLADTYWMNFSGNLKWFLNTRRIRPFINGGTGFYKTNDNSTYYFGFNVGGGIAVQIKPTFYIESAYNYHRIRMKGNNIIFSTTQLGLRLRF